MNSIICVLGWEERFLLGLEIILKKHQFNNLILISFEDYKTMPGIKENEIKIHDIVKQHQLELKSINLVYSDTVENWKLLDTFFEEFELGNEVMLNITTFPRETIWTLLFFLKKRLSYVHYEYFKPKEYDKLWLTKNHKNPRLLFKHSGVFELNQELALFIITGFDSSRLDMIIEYYEPTKIVLFCHNGKQFNNLKRNIGIKLSPSIKFEKVIINSYDINNTSDILNKTIEKYSDHNIIISSQGPKTSALSTYKSYIKSENKVALAYVAAKDFSCNYSTGIDERSIEGKFDFSF